MSYNHHSSNTLPWPIMAILFVICLFLVGIQESDQKETINKAIQEKGGQVVYIDSRSWNIGPFSTWSKGKYDDVYKVTYIVNGEPKEAWVEFQSQLIHDKIIWNWDYVEGK